MHPVDMDNAATWPTEVTAFLTAHSKELRAERVRDRKYSLSPSTYRIMNNPPAMPRWREAKALIEKVMAERELIAFHATRLIDFNHIRRDGLKVLDIEQHVARLKSHLQEAEAFEELAEIDAAVDRMLQADRHFINRQGAVWATPYRASLHDGGCEVFFESYGGEALGRIASYAGGKLERRLKQLGKPAVVIIRYPGRWCTFTDGRLPQSMIELHLEHEGNWTAIDHGWDIMISRDVPAENIVDVVPYDAPAVAA